MLLVLVMFLYQVANWGPTTNMIFLVLILLFLILFPIPFLLPIHFHVSKSFNKSSASNR